MSSKNSESGSGPRWSVWNYLEETIDRATNEELSDYDPDFHHEFKVYEELASEIVNARGRLVTWGEEFPGFADEAARDALVRDQWFRFAFDLTIAREGIARAGSALGRYAELQFMASDNALPEKASEYLREVAATFAFGFDPACIALCRAALEQVLKDMLVQRGVYTEPYLRRSKPSTMSQLKNAKRKKLVTEAGYRAGERVIERGNDVMHSHIYDKRILKKQASSSIRDLLIFIRDTDRSERESV